MSQRTSRYAVRGAHHVNGVFGFELEVIKLLRLDQNVMPFGVFIALDDFLVGHFDKVISVPNAFDITDRLPARLMDHAKRYRFLRGDGRTQLDGNEDEGQAKVA